MSIIIVTCSELHAEEYLRSLPREQRKKTVIVTTAAPGHALKEAGLAESLWVMGGLSSLDAVRRNMAAARKGIAIVVGPDYGSLSYRRRFIRRRLYAPWVLPRSQRADLIRIDRRGKVVSAEVDRGRLGLIVRLYPRDLWLLACYLCLGVLAVPVGLFTVVRSVPAVAWTEARAWLRGNAPSAVTTVKQRRARK